MVAQFRGKVIEGKKRGKKLGFPTANIRIPEKLAEGIYLSITTWDDKEYPSLTFIGSAKTYNEAEYLAETYILGFDRDLYGKSISVQLLEKIRDNQKFVSEEALVKQMKDDTLYAERYFKKEGYSL